MVQVGPPPIGGEPPAPSASAVEWGTRDQLRAEKSYLDAMDYYEVAVSKNGATGSLSTDGICDLMFSVTRRLGRTSAAPFKVDPHSF